MDSSGQGAIEYLTTYGWAILVVMVAGVIFWQLGVFDIAGGGGTRSTGFNTLKPLEATCQMAEDTVGYFGINYNGTTCEFVNAEPAKIVIDTSNDIMIKVNDKTCGVMFVTYGAGTRFRVCTDESGTCPGNGGSVEVPAGSKFTVETFDYTVPFGGFGPCANINPGTIYDMKVELTYEVTLAGSPRTKHEIGHIHGKME